MSDVPTPDEIINGTFKPKPPAPEVPPKLLYPADALKAAAQGAQCAGIVIQAPEGFVPTPGQIRAMQLVLSGLPFVIVAIEETFAADDKAKETATGADFHTVLHGDHGPLRNAGPDLPGVIERLYAKHGIV